MSRGGRIQRTSAQNPAPEEKNADRGEGEENLLAILGIYPDELDPEKLPGAPERGRARGGEEKKREQVRLEPRDGRERLGEDGRRAARQSGAGRRAHLNALNELHHDRDDRENHKNVNETAEKMEAEPADQPENQ